MYEVFGELTYINFNGHLERLKGLDVDNVIVDFKHVNYIDLDGFDALGEAFEEMEVMGMTICLLSCCSG